MDYKNINDYEIMYMIRENDDESRKLMFDKYAPIVNNIAANYSVLVKGIGVDMDDLIQEGYIALNDAIDKYDESSGVLFYTFACLCIKRHLITYCKRANNYKNYYLNYAIKDESLYNLKDDKIDFYNLDNIFFEEMFVRFKNLFNFVDSSIFELRYNGFSYKEISSLLDIAPNIVDSKVSKIRKVLKSKLKYEY